MGGFVHLEGHVTSLGPSAPQGPTAGHVQSRVQAFPTHSQDHVGRGYTASLDDPNPAG